MLHDWKLKGYTCTITHDVENVVYKYIGTGYFPEVVARLEEKSGKFVYMNKKDKVIHVRKSQVKYLNKPSLEEIKAVLRYLDEELLVEGTFKDVCEYVNTLKEIK